MNVKTIEISYMLFFFFACFLCHIFTLTACLILTGYFFKCSVAVRTARAAVLDGTALGLFSLLLRDTTLILLTIFLISSEE